MIKGDAIIGTYVVDKRSRDVIAQVKDIIFNQKTNQVVAFMLSFSSRQRPQVLPWSGIEDVQDDMIVARSGNMLVDAADLFEVQRILRRDKLKKGMPLVTTDGHTLGEMNDIYFDEDTGFIEGYEASHQDESVFIQIPQSIQIREGIAYIPPSAVEDLPINN